MKILMDIFVMRAVCPLMITPMILFPYSATKQVLWFRARYFPMPDGHTGEAVQAFYGIG